MGLKVYIAEDHDYIRMALQTLLASLDDVDVVGEAAEAATALEQIAALAPDVVLMDISLPDANGIDVTRVLVEGRPGLCVIALSGHADLEWVGAALAAGARGYVLKDVAFDDLPLALEATSAGGHFVSKQIRGAEALLGDHLARRGEVEGSRAGPTGHDRDVSCD